MVENTNESEMLIPLLLFASSLPNIFSPSLCFQLGSSMTRHYPTLFILNSVLFSPPFRFTLPEHYAHVSLMLSALL